jgi:hypothetical protein
MLRSRFSNTRSTSTTTEIAVAIVNRRLVEPMEGLWEKTGDEEG